MTRHPFNGSLENKRFRTGKLHYQGVVEIVEDKKTALFHTSFGIHLHDGHSNRTSEEKRVTILGEFTTEHDALSAALDQAQKYFR
ncbi:MAG TPA: hypothetical protein VGO35_04795 [Gammaproteobacteria bacterium]|jgi:hypothetical protein|nr:hypothetical protein [Gammaproteobacteria bacterium]